MISATPRILARPVGLALLMGAVAASSASAAVVFDNTLNVQPGFKADTSKQYGDEISLSGTDRYVTELRFQYQGDFELTIPTPTATVRIYANDGPSALPGQSTAPRPGTLLWESGPLNLAPGDNVVSVAPNVLVPNVVTWSIEFSGLSGAPGDRAALTISSPPTVGGQLPGGVTGSFDDYWVKVDPSNSESWAIKKIEGQPSNFYAHVTAIPEPSTVALAILGFGGLAYFQRRRSTR